jgi:signal transduction histidine kinase
VDGGADGKAAARSEAMARQVGRLSALVARMLDAAAIRAGGISLDQGPCDLSAIVEARARAVADRAGRAGCAFDVRVEPAIGGRWDSGRMGQVVDELLDNALKFGCGKPVSIVLEKEGPDAVLTVEDNGVGIPTDRLSHIFSPFERAVSREHFGGLGLGLHVTKAVVEAHGGAVEVESHPGRGTTLVVRLPIHAPPDAGPMSDKEATTR